MATEVFGYQLVQSKLTVEYLRTRFPTEKRSHLSQESLHLLHKQSKMSLFAELSQVEKCQANYKTDQFFFIIIKRGKLTKQE